MRLKRFNDFTMNEEETNDFEETKNDFQYIDTVKTKNGLELIIGCNNPESYSHLIGCAAFLNGENVAEAAFRNKDGVWYAMHAETNKSKRNLGIMSAIYDYVESKFKIKLEPSKEQSDDAVEFWKKRL